MGPVFKGVRLDTGRSEELAGELTQPGHGFRPHTRLRGAEAERAFAQAGSRPTRAVARTGDEAPQTVKEQRKGPPKRAWPVWRELCRSVGCAGHGRSAGGSRSRRLGG